jgi:hypothetical protein
MDPDIIRMQEVLVILEQGYEVPERDNAPSPFTGTVVRAPGISLSVLTRRLCIFKSNHPTALLRSCHDTLYNPEILEEKNTESLVL